MLKSFLGLLNLLEFLVDYFLNDFLVVLGAWIVRLTRQRCNNLLYLHTCSLREILELLVVLGNFRPWIIISPQILDHAFFFLLTLSLWFLLLFYSEFLDSMDLLDQLLDQDLLVLRFALSFLFLEPVLLQFVSFLLQTFLAHINLKELIVLDGSLSCLLVLLLILLSKSLKDGFFVFNWLLPRLLLSHI